MILFAFITDYITNFKCILYSLQVSLHYEVITGL